MKINFVYDFISSDGTIINGVNPKHLELFFDGNFSFNRINISEFHKKISHPINYSKPDYLYDYDNSIDTSLDYIQSINNDELYLYPLSTSGDVFEFLSERVSSGPHETSFKFISTKVKKFLENFENFYIYLEHAGEPYFTSDLLKKMYDLCEMYDIRFDKIIMINGTNSNEFIIEDFKEKYNIAKLPILASYNWPLPFKALELRTYLGNDNADIKHSTFADVTHINYNKTKKCLFLTKRLRLHRLLMLIFLNEKDILNKFKYSFDSALNVFDLTTLLEKQPEALPIKIPKEKYKFIADGFLKLLKIEKNILDFEDFNSIHGFGMETKELYEDTYFSLVGETEFSITQESITEKIMKPIQHYHPFICLGSPYTLKLLKSYGFKTFSEFWDESYDDELDDWKRFNLVFDLVITLVNKSDDEWRKLLTQMKDILEFNRNHLLTFDDIFILNELKNNIPKILSKGSIKLL